MFDTNTCMSGTLCVTVSGLTTSPFTNVAAGKTMFFDFDDDAEQILQKGTDLKTQLIRENAQCKLRKNSTKVFNHS